MLLEAMSGKRLFNATGPGSSSLLGLRALALLLP
jgi:hypothetical protein